MSHVPNITSHDVHEPSVKWITYDVNDISVSTDNHIHDICVCFGITCGIRFLFNYQLITINYKILILFWNL